MQHSTQQAERLDPACDAVGTLGRAWWGHGASARCEAMHASGRRRAGAVTGSCDEA